MALLVLLLMLSVEVTEKAINAKAALVAGEYIKAAVMYEELARISPQTEEWQVNHASALIQAGRFRDALPPLERALKLNATGPAIFLTGIAYRRMREPGKAAPFLEQALDLNPGNTMIASELAEAYSLGDPPSRARQLLPLIPESSTTHVILARLSRADGRHRDAIADWDRALAYIPGDEDLLLERARSMRDAGMFDEAEDALGRLAPSAARNLLIAEIAVARGEPERGLLPAVDAARRDPKLTAARVLAGRLLLDAGRAEEAIPHFQAALAQGADVRRELRRARRYTQTP